MTDASPPPNAAASSSSDAPDPDAVRDALLALATGASPSPRQAFRETVADADAATRCAVEASAFLRAGRLPELARAVADAEASDAAGASSAVETGARALSTLRRLDSAARRGFGGECADVTEAGSQDVDAASIDAATVAESPAEEGVRLGTAAADHFRSGRDIVLPRTGQRTDR